MINRVPPLPILLIIFSEESKLEDMVWTIPLQRLSSANSDLFSLRKGVSGINDNGYFRCFICMQDGDTKHGNLHFRNEKVTLLRVQSQHGQTYGLYIQSTLPFWQTVDGEICSNSQALRAAYVTSSYPGWIKSPHVVTLGILKISDLDSLTIFMGKGGIPE